MRRIGLALVALMAVLLPEWASAAPILATSTYARFFFRPEWVYACDVYNGPCNGSAVAPGTNWTVNYEARAAAEFGVMHAESSLFLTGDDSLGPLDGGSVPFPNLVSVGARAGFREGFTVAGDDGPGTLLLTFSVSGTSSQTGGGLARPLFQSLPVVDGTPDVAQELSYGVAPDGTAMIPLSFTFGQPIEYEIWFYALAQILTAAGWDDATTAHADYFSTAVLSGIAVRNSGGDLLDSFTIASASGTSYTATGVLTPEQIVTPEPASLLLLGTGVLGIGRHLRRRRS